MKKVTSFLIVLALTSSSIFAIPILKEETLAFVIELQIRPFTFPTDWSTPAIRKKVEDVTGKYALFVWNKSGKNIVKVVSGDDLEQLFVDYAGEASTRTGRSIPAFEFGKSVIKNGKVIRGP